MGNIKLISSKGKNRKRKTGTKTAFTICAIIFVGLATFTVSFGFYVRSLNTIFPNVWADGIKMSGMTLDEATEVLVRAGYESNAADVSATIMFPDSSGFTIFGEEVGFSLDAEEAAIAAYECGRSGSFLENEIIYARSLFTRTDISDTSLARFDREMVRYTVATHTKEFNNAITKDAYTVGSDSIVIEVGTGIKPADEDSVYELTVETLLTALEAQTHITAAYTPPPDEGEGVDLEFLHSITSVEPVSAVYDPVTFGATESIMGARFDLEEAQALLAGANNGERIVIPMVSIKPEITKEEMEEMLFRDVLAERTTRNSGSSNRLNNIKIASEAIDGLLLNPGDVFSFNETVGNRTRDKGYREAGAYVGGRLVDEVGGGICQVSSTIYDCVLHADLDIVERTPHGMTVSYLPLGQDATVTWGAIDFKFRNNTRFPVRIDISIKGQEITVQLMGTKLDDNYILLRYDRISSTPFRVIEQEDESVPQGQTRVYTDGYTGYVVETFKDFYDAEDNLIKTVRVGRSTYRVSDRIILIPVPLEGTEQPPGTDPLQPGDPPPDSSSDPAADAIPNPPPAQTPDMPAGDGAPENNTETSRQEPIL